MAKTPETQQRYIRKRHKACQGERSVAGAGIYAVMSGICKATLTLENGDAQTKKSFSEIKRTLSL